MNNLSHVNWGYVLASTQTVISALAAIGYGLAGDWKRFIYWACAAGITAVVTWGFQ